MTANNDQFPQLAAEFVFTTLAFSPANATQYGLHHYQDREGRSLLLDELLDDLSPSEIARQRAFYEGFRTRLRAIKRTALDLQTRVDFDLLENALAFALFSLDEEQFHRRKPQFYPENLGSALFNNICLEYADKATRARHLCARVERIPAFIDQARANLSASNEIYRATALQSIEGVVGLLTGLARDFVSTTELRARYEQALAPALEALERFAGFVRDELPARGEFDWRAGAARYQAKWRYYLQVSFSPEEMLAVAQAGMRETRAQMLRLAEPLHDSWFPDHRHDGSDRGAYLNEIVSEVMAQIGREHTHRDRLLEQAERDAAEIGDYIRKHRLLSMQDFSNLRIIPTPEFMRGIYTVAAAVFAPALEPQLASFYWVTPIPQSWSAERAESKLREYNRYKMLQLTVHEALPGHYVQGQYANHIVPEWRRLLRVIYGNTPYIEGWAVYTEHMMEATGLNGGDATKMRLTALKAMLRIYANAIIDIGLHMQAMSEEQALELMMRDAFQELPEAEGKLQRAKLDYVQLCTYLAGLREWMMLRADEEQRLGAQFDLRRFHDTTLLYGPIPVPMVRQLLINNEPPTAQPIKS